jgi:hypothetical protein
MSHHTTLRDPKPLPLDPDTELASDHFNVPAWIDQGLTLRDMEGIQDGGCASGAYMPAVTYHVALATMAQHGDDVLEYLEEHDADLTPPKGESWSGLACYYLSMAVEIWAGDLDMRQMERERDREIETWEDDHGWEAPSSWASYLINGDSSGLEAEEIARADAFVRDVVASAGHAHFYDVVERGFTNYGEFKGHDVSLYFLAGS